MEWVDCPRVQYQHSRAWPLLQSITTAGRSRQLQLPEPVLSTALRCPCTLRQSPGRHYLKVIWMKPQTGLLERKRLPCPGAEEAWAALCLPFPKDKVQHCSQGKVMGWFKLCTWTKLLHLPVCCRTELYPCIAKTVCWGLSLFIIQILCYFIKPLFLIQSACKPCIKPPSPTWRSFIWILRKILERFWPKEELAFVFYGYFWHCLSEFEV